MQVSERQTEADDVGEPAAEDEDKESFEPVTEETDEEYVPAAELGCLSASVPSARKRKAQLETDKTENKEVVEGESRKDCVLCPICDKSFKSKYYLKVHNRYRGV